QSLAEINNSLRIVIFGSVPITRLANTNAAKSHPSEGAARGGIPLHGEPHVVGAVDGLRGGSANHHRPTRRMSQLRMHQMDTCADILAGIPSRSQAKMLAYGLCARQVLSRPIGSRARG